jgi:hypothetical protein
MTKAYDVAIDGRKELTIADHFDKFDPIYKRMERLGAPSPLPNESPHAYHVRLLEGIQPLARDKHLRRVDFAEPDLINKNPGAFAGLAQNLVDEVSATLSDPTLGSFRRPGQMRIVEFRNEAGAMIREYHGNSDNWMDQFKHPRIEVAGFPGDRLLGWRRPSE